MKCFYCRNKASAKIGKSKGSIIKALFGRDCWDKKEIYVCKKHYKKILRQEKEMQEEQDREFNELFKMQKWGL
jgi:hypothetical protein